MVKCFYSRYTLYSLVLLSSHTMLFLWHCFFSTASSVGETPSPNVNPDSVQPMTNKRFNNPFRRRPKRSASELESIGSSDMPNIR